jgi:hypothetical protein
MNLRRMYAPLIILSLSLAGVGPVASVGVGAQGRAYRASERQMRRLVRGIETRADRFARSVSNTLDRGRRDGTRREDEINRLVAEFRQATDRLRARFDSNSLSEADVRLVLERAAPINSLVRDSRLGLQSERQWVRLRTDLDQLAGNYNVAWDWNNPPAGGVYAAGYDAMTTGTYRLNVSRSDDPRRVADAATRGLAYSVRQRINDSLVQRLNPPETLAVERRGMTVTLASTRSPRVTFEADGREHAESYPNGRASRVRASLSGDVLTVVSNGDRANDFTITINPVDGGRRLLVARSLYAERLDRPVVLRSYYDRVSDVARLDLYNPFASGAYNNGVATNVSGNFVVPDGTRLVAALNTDLNTRYTREGDRFTMTVRSPAQYEGAVIEGHVSGLDRSGRVTGRSQMTLNYDTVRLRDGRTYRFAGSTEGVRTAAGEVVRVDNEGTAAGDSRTDDTITRTAIGTAIGAIIGAIAGGGKGAAIGATVGAGAGAGSVYVQGSEDLALPAGTEVTVRASAPR